MPNKFTICMATITILIACVLILLYYVFAKYVLRDKVKFREAVAAMIYFAVLTIIGCFLSPIFMRMMDFVWEMTN